MSSKSQIRSILHNNKIINKFSKINVLYNFYQNLFSQNKDCLDISATEVLNKLNIPNNDCLDISATEVLNKLNIPNNDCLDISATEVLNILNIPKLSFKEVQVCEVNITIDKIFEPLKSMKNNKSQEMMDFLRNSMKRSRLVQLNHF